MHLVKHEKVKSPLKLKIDQVQRKDQTLDDRIESHKEAQ